MAAGRVKEAWDQLARWYCHARGEQDQPTRDVLDQDLAVKTELYICRPPSRLKVLILFQPLKVNDEVPTESEVNLAVRGMRAERVGGPSGTRGEDLKGCLKEANREK